jgi:hypothetical protein
MSPRSHFTLRFAHEVITHLGAIEGKYHRPIEKTITEQLTIEPETETRNRKRLEQPAPYEATWELRFGPNNRFRVFYEVAENDIWVLAIGIKERNRLLIGGEEFEL